MPTQKSQEKSWLFFYICAGGCGSTCFQLRCPTDILCDGAPSSPVDRSHSLASFLPPQAAVSSLPIPNTEVKHTYADDSCRVTDRENR